MKTLLLVLLVCLPNFAYADLSSQGEIRMESRFFSDDDDTSTEDTNIGAAARLELHGKWNWFESRLQFFQRTDSRDESRNVFIIEEAWLSANSDNWQINVGSQILNWSATEAFHPADIINSRNFDSNLENAEKIGEPMVTVTRLFDMGSLSLYYMPAFMKPIMPESSNRLSFSNSAIPVGQPIFINRKGEVSTDGMSVQVAVKLDLNFSDSDLSLHYVDHTDRSQPQIYFNGSEVQLVYLPVKQTGLTYQHVLDAWVFKLEAAHRDFGDPVDLLAATVARLDHEQIAVGAEYGWTHENGWESVIITEGQSLLGVTKDERAALSIFQNDALLGYRLALNDTYSQEFFLAVITDTERDNETLYNLSYSRRLTDVWSLKSGFRQVNAPQKDPAAPVGLEYLHKANQFYLDISRHF